ncbi:MAG: nucleotide-binding universal stress UspA family protein [Gammaproteobacteria bacterium]|jgi:nucleotide-binding universal stress UspA family protein
MPFKEILLHVDATDSCIARLTCAIDFARVHNAHLVGLYVIEIPVQPGYALAAIPDDDILGLRRQPYLDSARHGIKAEARVLLGSNEQAAEIILRWAADQGSDLLVMGAYGRWRISEILLGSMTAQILKETTIPLLLAH